MCLSFCIDYLLPVDPIILDYIFGSIILDYILGSIIFESVIFYLWDDNNCLDNMLSI